MSDALRKAFRYDAGQLRPAVETSQGFLRLDGYVSRPGIYEYVNTRDDEAHGLGKAGTVRREYRPEEEAYRADMLAQFEGAPLTAGHPGQLITPKNARAYEIGTVTSQARRDGDRVAASMVVKDAATIARVKSGELVELSPGYTASIHRTPGADAKYATAGNPQGRYDCVQRDIEINHLALVPRARGGGDLRVRLDGADDVAIERRDDAELNAAARNELEGGDFAVPGKRKLPIHDEAHVRAAMSRFSQTEGMTPEERGAAMRAIVSAAHKFGIDTTGFEQAHRADSAPTRERNDMADMTPEQQIAALKLQLDQANVALAERKDALDAATVARDGATAKVKTLDERVQALEAKLAAGATAMETEAIAKHKERADAADAKLAELESSREADIRKAAETRLKAQAIMGAGFRCDGMSDRAIHAVVIKKFVPAEDVGDKVSAAYLASRFDSLVEAHLANARSLTSASEVLARRDGREPTSNPITREARARAWREQATNPKGYRAAFGLNEEA